MARYLLLFDRFGLFFCGAPSLTRGLVCLLYILLGLTSIVFLGSEYLRTRDHILLSQIWDFPFHRLLRLAGTRWRYSTPPPHGYWKWNLTPDYCLSLSLSHIATDGQSVSLSWYRAPSGAHDQIFVTVWQFLLCLWGGPSLTRGWVCLLSESVSSNKSIVSMYSYIHLTSSLYSLGADPQKTPSLNSSSIVRRCRGNAFTEPLPSNDHMRHNIYTLNIRPDCPMCLHGHSLLFNW
jgi:hypothetical protein